MKKYASQPTTVFSNTYTTVSNLGAPIPLYSIRSFVKMTYCVVLNVNVGRFSFSFWRGFSFESRSLCHWFRTLFDHEIILSRGHSINFANRRHTFHWIWNPNISENVIYFALHHSKKFGNLPNHLEIVRHTYLESIQINL